MPKWLDPEKFVPNANIIRNIDIEKEDIETPTPKTWSNYIKFLVIGFVIIILVSIIVLFFNKRKKNTR